MNISVKDYSYISNFIKHNHGKYSEAQMVAKVKSMLDAEFASEFAVEQLTFRAKPKTSIGERLLAMYGDYETANAMIPVLRRLGVDGFANALY